MPLLQERLRCCPLNPQLLFSERKSLRLDFIPPSSSSLPRPRSLADPTNPYTAQSRYSLLSGIHKHTPFITSLLPSPLPHENAAFLPRLLWRDDDLPPLPPLPRHPSPRSSSRDPSETRQGFAARQPAQSTSLSLDSKRMLHRLWNARSGQLLLGGQRHDHRQMYRQMLLAGIYTRRTGILE